jgi:uncharacterized damage-inducible protein DinB
MKNLALLALSTLFFAVITLTYAFAQSSPSSATTDKTPPSYDLKPQALVDLEALQKKFVELAEAIPADKYTWRPGADVRSVSELFLHVSSTTYQLAPMIGVAPAAGIDAKTLEKSTTDKGKIIEQLNRSFDYLRSGIANISNDDLKKPVKEFGPDASSGDLVYLIAMDAHEHLGQAITYARVNGIVPPWTVRANKKAAEKAKQ